MFPDLGFITVMHILSYSSVDSLTLPSSNLLAKELSVLEVWTVRAKARPAGPWRPRFCCGPNRGKN